MEYVIRFADLDKSPCDDVDGAFEISIDNQIPIGTHVTIKVSNEKVKEFSLTNEWIDGVVVDCFYDSVENKLSHWCDFE